MVKSLLIALLLVFSTAAQAQEPPAIGRLPSAELRPARRDLTANDGASRNKKNAGIALMSIGAGITAVGLAVYFVSSDARNFAGDHQDHASFAHSETPGIVGIALASVGLVVSLAGVAPYAVGVRELNRARPGQLAFGGSGLSVAF